MVYKNSIQKSKHVYVKVLMFVFLFILRCMPDILSCIYMGYNQTLPIVKKYDFFLNITTNFRQNKISNCQIENKHPANTLLHIFTEQPLIKFTMSPLPCAQENFKGVCCNFVQHQNQKHTQHVFQAI